MGRFLINGHGGREASIARRLATDRDSNIINAFMGHANPTIAELVERSGGLMELGDPTDPQLVGEFAVRSAIDLAIISGDASLASGVVDELEGHGIRTVGPNKETARIEHDKVFARQLIDDIDPSLNPFYLVAENREDIARHLRIFKAQGIPVVVKPSGLTGGKDVKVMGPHFSTYEEAAEIAGALLQEGHKAVLLEERIDMAHSVEFTVQAFTDGNEVITAPISIDYPYRYDGDTGSGTGGMGSFTEPGKPSYLTNTEVEKVGTVTRSIVHELLRRNLHFNGVLYVGFFATPNGLKIVECNARPGDPECMNMMMLLEGETPAIFENIAAKKLTQRDIRFRDLASVVIYLTHPEYATGQPIKPTKFFVDHKEVKKTGSKLFFASAVRGNQEQEYVTTGASRSVAVGALGDTLSEARDKAYQAIENGIRGPLEYRREIGDPRYVQKLVDSRL